MRIGASSFTWTICVQCIPFTIWMIIKTIYDPKWSVAAIFRPMLCLNYDIGHNGGNRIGRVSFWRIIGGNARGRTTTCHLLPQPEATRFGKSVNESWFVTDWQLAYTCSQTWHAVNTILSIWRRKNIEFELPITNVLTNHWTNSLTHDPSIFHESILGE